MPQHKNTVAKKNAVAKKTPWLKNAVAKKRRGEKRAAYDRCFTCEGQARGSWTRPQDADEILCKTMGLVLDGVSAVRLP
jgi:hypothetical protein